jgi:phosphopantothenoylcysteine synthetase/decarboxylase
MGRKIVVGVTASIAAYKAADLVTSLVKQGHEVQVMMTEAARKFVHPLTFQTLSARPVVTDLFKRYEQYDPLHIKIADWCDLILVVPASAAFMARIATGIIEDALSCTIYASSVPVLFAPAMNTKMWTHPVTQENATKLKEMGYSLVGPVEGRLASGYEGMGRLADLEDILAALEGLISEQR